MEAQCEITRAQARVLIKASAHPVMIAGGFSGKPELGQWRHPRFDRQTPIDRLIVAGLLEPGVGANTFVLTPGGGHRP